MAKYLFDSSFFVSLAFDLDSNHPKAKKYFQVLLKKDNILLTTQDFVKETLTTISQRLGKKASIDFHEFLSSTFEVLPITSDQFDLGINIFLDPKINKNISLVDCIASIVCKETGSSAIITFDKHFAKLELKCLP